MAPAPLLDVLVIGAGPAGLGTALALAAVDDLDFAVVERGQIGQTFLDWPSEQQFLTPSFTSNGYGAIDLNAIHPNTSPAFSLGVDYPSGPEYASHLEALVEHFELPVRTGIEVHQVESVTDGSIGDHFVISTSDGQLRARRVVWAGGEFSDRPDAPIAGIELADHSATPQAWVERPGRVVIIGGYESGIDQACHHVACGSQVTVLDARGPWDPEDGPDPSHCLAPRSQLALDAAHESHRLDLVDQDATGIEQRGDQWVVTLGDDTEVLADSRPIAATGFGPGLGPVGQCFERRPDGWPELDEDDQSTTTPGLFIAGPAVRHEAMRFCFVFKFRQRFAHVARVIGESLGKDCEALELWRASGMLIDDLSCCGTDCAC